MHNTAINMHQLQQSDLYGMYWGVLVVNFREYLPELCGGVLELYK